MGRLKALGMKNGKSCYVAMRTKHNAVHVTPEPD